MVVVWVGKRKDERCVLRACAVRSAVFGSGGGCTSKTDWHESYNRFTLLVFCVIFGFGTG